MSLIFSAVISVGKICVRARHGGQQRVLDDA
jgi:hypothetical protein